MPHPITPLPQASGCGCIPLPSGTGCPPTNTIPSGVQSIRMFFGYEPKSSGNPNPGELNKLFYTPTGIDIYNGFRIPGYSCKSLKDSGILDQTTSFVLTEKELLSTGTFETWLLYGSRYSALKSQNALTLGWQDEPFSCLCLKDPAIAAITSFEKEAATMWVSALEQLDFMGLYSSLHNSIIQQEAKLTNITNVRDFCTLVKDNHKIEKLKLCYEWFKNIFDTYYGKEFLVNIGSGICIKDETLALSTGVLPSSSGSPKYSFPYYIEADGTSQGFYTSDEIVNAGFPKFGSTSILGLQKIDWVQDNDGKIESFAKIGSVYNPYDTSNSCSGLLKNRTLYKKFKFKDDCLEHNIDIGKLDISNYHLEDNILYVKSAVENRFYIDSYGTWVRVTLSEKVPLSPITINNAQGAIIFAMLLDIAAASGIDKRFNNFSTGGIPRFGALGNSSQGNIANMERPCLMPEGVVIPLKSNVYRYGPYFHITQPDDGGGAEIVVQDNLAPWNFIKPNDPSFPGTYPYCAMDSFGKDLAKLSQKGVQRLEKGRMTSVGLPCLALGPITGVPPSGALDPTLLTDISVDFGNGGFTTSYNFSTYTPRFGKTERYLLDSWQDNIKSTNFINSYLKNEKVKTENIRKEFTKKIIDKNYFFARAAKEPLYQKPTPKTLLFAGYHIGQISGTLPYSGPLPPSPTGYPSGIPCSGMPPVIVPPLGAIPYTYDGRRYSWADSTEAYSIDYIQNTYFQLAGISNDGLYLPISIRGVGNPLISDITGVPGGINTNPSWSNEARLPRFAMRCDTSGNFVEWDSLFTSTDFKNKPGYPIVSKNRDEIPPFKLDIGAGQTEDCYSLAVHQHYLNPYTTTCMLDASSTGASSGNAAWDRITGANAKGFVVSSIVFGQEHLSFQLTHTTEDLDAANEKWDSAMSDEAERQLRNNFRVPALRGPLVLQGWGYDTAGRPIPNEADYQGDTFFGKFRQYRLTDRFQEGWLENPRTWPVGPIDLRFDRNRGVWTCPSPNKIIVARLKESLSAGGSATAELLNEEADDIRFYEQYHISGPNGQDIKLDMTRTEIRVYDFLGQSLPECTKVYVYYDDNRYIVLNSDRSSSENIRFKAIKLCESTESTSSAYSDDWGLTAGFGDKFYNHDTYGVRIDCDGNIIDINGQSVPSGTTINQQFFIDNATDWLIKLNDNAGKFGPSYALFTSYNEWNTRAATGYATLINNNISPSGCLLGKSDNCLISKDALLSNYDIIFIESYARFLHGCLDQDLYTSVSGAAKYGDPYKSFHPSGNATVTISHFYGDSPNGQEPIYLASNYQQLKVRVFDPWLDKNLNPISCYNPENSIFYNAPSGTPFVAVFNEKEKKYYLTQISSSKKSDNIIRFKAVKLCSGTEDTATPYNNDPWASYAGYGDKFPNTHVYGIRINCDGQIIDRNGNTTNQAITQQFLIDNATDWLVRLNDNAGKFGPSYSLFTDYATWNSRAATGYAAVIDNDKGTCSLGSQNSCTIPGHDNLKVYDIIFIESYARFVECTLSQNLYSDSTQYPADTFKTSYPSGNAAAAIQAFYGDSPNGNQPIFLQQNLSQIPFRVFDPFIGTDIQKNPFAHLKANDKVLAIFDEDEKKYIIWQSLKSKDQNNDVVKFALVTDKNPHDLQTTAVLVDEYGRPIDSDGNLLDANTFNVNNWITVLDPIRNRAGNAPPPNNSTLLVDYTQGIFGPALGSNDLNEHLNGITLGDGNVLYTQMAPFIGFALKRTTRNYNGDENIVYEMFMLEHYAKYVFGKICSKYEIFQPPGVIGPCYLGSKATSPGGYVDGRAPIARETINLPRGDVVVHSPGTPFNGFHSFIIGDGGINKPRFNDTDGCGFIGSLNIHASTTTHLVYELIEAERVALKGHVVLNRQNPANILNDNNNLAIDYDGSNMISIFSQGFMWNKNTPNYITTKIINRPELENRGLFIKGSPISVSLAGKDINHNLIYEVVVGGTIAKVTNRYIHNAQPGLFGYNDDIGGGIPAVDRKIDTEDKFYEGLNPTVLDIADRPKINTIRPWIVGPNAPPAAASQQWMTFGSGVLTALWNETLDANGNVTNCTYEIIYAEQAPILITGKAKVEIDPLAPNALAQIETLSNIFASCRGADREPISSGPTLLVKVKNPMGHGAKIGDYVTLQRVYTGVVADDANYYYMIIGTGDPPGALK